MAKFYALGNYTAQGFQGFCKDPGSDRSKAAQIAAEAVGAKMISFSGLRGSYDFMAVFEGDFSQGAGIKMSLKQWNTLQHNYFREISLNDVATNAAKIVQKYKGVGQ